MYSGPASGGQPGRAGPGCPRGVPRILRAPAPGLPLLDPRKCSSQTQIILPFANARNECPSIHPPIHPSADQSIHPSIHPPIRSFIHLLHWFCCKTNIPRGTRTTCTSCRSPQQRGPRFWVPRHRPRAAAPPPPNTLSVRVGVVWLGVLSHGGLVWSGVVFYMFAPPPQICENAVSFARTG
eukprot:gene14592-biopygen9647